MKITIIFKSRTWSVRCQAWCFPETTLSFN